MDHKLINRQNYLDQALLFRDTDLVKVVTGVRRCGKSSLLQLVRQHLESEGKPDRAFISLNLEDRKYGIVTDNDLYLYVKEHLSETGRSYIFLDEIQRIEGWHDIVNSLRVGADCDLYVTGSNAFLLSSELATYLSGRYIELKMLPLAFSEFLDFCGLSFGSGSTVAAGGMGQIFSFDDIFHRYLDYGGMPAIAALDTAQTIHSHYMEGLYNTVIVRDIMHRERTVSGRQVTSPDLLKAICEYLADNIGNMASAKKIADTFTSSGRKTHHDTVRSYIKALEDAYIFYPAKRYDIHGKAILKTLPKYYVVDTGLRRFLAGYRESDRGFVFENAVYLQLLFEGWSIHVGKLYQNEVDFIATKDGKLLYVQVADELYSEDTRQRELKSLLAISDAHEKIIVVRQGDHQLDIKGVQIISARDFFLKD